MDRKNRITVIRAETILKLRLQPFRRVRRPRRHDIVVPLRLLQLLPKIFQK